ncbi:MAG: ATP-grasp domain-containing protein [Bacteroidetes bacterium]|jgi:carbamoyl-phosphate synthase large subunit|nr:ATP-grasp domain-containing protein [Bacteroidota bacterium]MBT3751585.1 ATP-grasp domain-containing protein [Bacteroidota bacterium]MBT4401819.1 ATP-grasp domain-containing protein [Bacteroidota bacterium]MBT4410251.1 ATP-grasp domain-containing protein [Bacteroidota bacterium]MBT5425427.1 ATP-grasp domain-containing protein [Bacteroidota bacterium]
MTKKRKITVAVSGLNNTDNPGPGVPVIRALRESAKFDVRIIGLVYETLEPGIYMEGIADQVYIMPYPSNGIQAVYYRLAQINDEVGIDVLIPNFDSELISMIKLEDDLLELGIHMLLPSLQNYEERHKSVLPVFGEKYGVLVPKSFPLSSAGDIHQVMRELSYPVVIKGNMYDASVVHSLEQALAQFYRISMKWGLPVILQEFVKGTEVNVVALGDGKGRTIGAVPMRKQYITDKGKAWGGITIANEEMMKLTDHIISSMKWGGGMELELIRTDNNDMYLIEINPRIPAWVYLAVGAGQNLPEAMVDLALGNDVEPYTDYRVGTMFVRYSYDNIAQLEDYQDITATGTLNRENNGKEKI